MHVLSVDSSALLHDVPHRGSAKTGTEDGEQAVNGLSQEP